MSDSKDFSRNMMKSDMFEFAARVKMVLDRTDTITKLDLSEIEKLERITRAAAGACGVACGGC